MEAVRAPLACVAAMLQCWQAGRICGAGAGRAALTAVGLSWEKTNTLQTSASSPDARAALRPFSP